MSGSELREGGASETPPPPPLVAGSKKSPAEIGLIHMDSKFISGDHLWEQHQVSLCPTEVTALWKVKDND